MTILPSDIRLLESERMTDNTDGGGRRTSRVIPDGVAGNIFPKVSRVDSVYGRVNLRKIFPHVNTTNLDVYAGAHFIITDAPDNDRIHVTAFSTASDFDLRTAARDRIESYVIAGPQSRLTLYGRQLKGAQALLLYQREEEPLPEVGDVYAVSNESGSTTIAQQFVRIQDVAHEVRTFTDSAGDFRRRAVTLTLGSPLRFEFSGLASPDRYSNGGATGKLRSTTVADAARYYGIQPLTAVGTVGALELAVASVYTPIVPTTQRESAVSLATIAGAVSRQAAATAVVQETIAWNSSGVALSRRALRPIHPGSLRIRAKHVKSGSSVAYSPWVSDTGAGVIPATTGNPYTDAGAVDYETGAISVQIFSQYADDTVFLEIEYIPAVEVSQTAHTKSLPVTLATRGTVYSVPLLPLPAPGTLIVEYRALGKWYRLRDNGAGELTGGDAAYGTGTVNYVTGGVIVTLGALPDVGSSVLLSWGSPVHYEILADAPSLGFDITVAQTPVRPGSVVLTWLEAGVTKTATDNGSGLITGDATGTIVYQTGAISLALANPIVGDVAVDYDLDDLITSQSGHEFGGAVAPFSVSVAGVNLTLPSGAAFLGLTLRDNGAGELHGSTGAIESGYGLVSGYIAVGEFYFQKLQSFGTVNYDTGVVTLSGSVPVSRLYSWSPTLGGWLVAGTEAASLSSTTAVFSSRLMADVGSGVPSSQTVPLGADGLGLTLQLGQLLPRAVVPESVLFTAFGKSHIDRSGSIYTDVSPITGSGMLVGSINYDTGEIRLYDYPSGATSALTVQACLRVKGNYTATSVSFRTAGSPVRPASLYIQCTAENGSLLTGASDQNGNVTGDLTGAIEQSMGVTVLNSAVPVFPGTLRYSTVVLSNLPLDAEILGLDPVRLPSDGRVPIYRPADVVVVHHTDSYDAGTPTAGSTLNVGRTNLSLCWLEDAARKKLASSLYAANLETGVVTMAADLSLVGYTTPITVRHRIEEMGLLSDVQINGQVTLTAPLTQAFPLGSYLSSALLYGDLQARVTNVFDQQTWTNVWQNTPIGSGATAQYNDVDYPLEILNEGAITERWRLNFTSTTAFQVIGENMGVIATGTTGADFQPVNPLTTKPYFTLRFAGWGLGWAVGNQLRFDTIAAAPPTWLARTVLPGATLGGDSFDAQLRGDVD